MVQEGARVALTTRLTRRAGLPRRCQRGVRREAKLRGDGSAPPAPASQDAPGDFICSKASASTKRRSSSDGALGKPEPRHPTPESPAMGAPERCRGAAPASPPEQLPRGEDALQAGGQGQSCPRLAQLLAPEHPSRAARLAGLPSPSAAPAPALAPTARQR